MGFLVLRELQVSDCGFQLGDFRLKILTVKNQKLGFGLQSEACNLPYSYLSASTGSSFEARNAGTRPLTTPTASSTNVESITVASEIRR
jgi:hypothetical protein